MVETSSPHGAPVLFRAIDEANKALIESDHSQEYRDLINTLPVKSYGPGQHRLYQGFWLPEFFVPGVLNMQNCFQPRSSDLFLASYPKSGTTWLKALVFAIMTRTNYSMNQHPLLTNNPHQCIAYMEKEFSLDRSFVIEAIPSPRILSTHMPHSLLPNSIVDADCQIIYVSRDPKDVFVSMYHFACEINKDGDHKVLFDELFSMFCDGVSTFGPIWDHILGYWRKSVERPEKYLFLKYEEMLLEPKKHVKMIAKFIGKAFLEEEEEQGVIEQIIELCSLTKLKNLEVNNTSWRPPGFDSKNASRSAFFRKGMVGDFKNHMTSEMAETLDNIIDEKFKRSGLKTQARTMSN